MFKNIILGGLAALLLTFSSTAATYTPEQRMLEYIEWIEENSELEYDGQPLPTVEYASQEVMQIYVWGPDRVAKSQHDNEELPEVIGVYRNDINQIVLEEGQDITSKSISDVVVHELVHYLQYLHIPEDRWEGICKPKLEQEAYRLDIMWSVNEYFRPGDGVQNSYDQLWDQYINAMYCNDPVRGMRGGI